MNTYTGTLNTYPLTGTVTVGGTGLPGVTVTATGSGGFTASGVTTTGGAYTINGVAHFATGITLSATLTGYTFTPLTIAGPVTGSLSNENITGTLNTYPVTGTVTVGGTGLGGVTVAASGGFTASVTTDVSGNYTISGVPHFTTGVVLTATLKGYTFNPLTIAGPVTGSLSNENITGTLNSYALTTSVLVSATGSVLRSPDSTTYPYGSTVSLTASPARNYQFFGWQGDAGGAGNTNPLPVLIDGPKNITAVFIIDTPAVITVSTLSESALRQAIAVANAHPGADTIRFTASGTLTLSDSLPGLTDQVFLDGAGQTNYNGTPQVTLTLLNGSTSTRKNGLSLLGGFSTVRGFDITQFAGAGIYIRGDSNTVVGNVIEHNHGNGVLIEDGNGNTIGGRQPGSANTIDHNDTAGVAVRQSSSVLPPSGNAILGNSIFLNGSLGIDLSSDGVTPDHYQPGPSKIVYRPAVPPGVNFFQNYPLLAYASTGAAGQATVEGSLLNWPKTPFRIEIFANDSVNASGYGEGKTLIASQVVTTNDTGYSYFIIPSNAPLTFGQYISATATDSAGNTSEFSASLPVGVKTKYYGNHYVLNTTLSGIPLHWADGKGAYTISASIPVADTPAINASFNTWNSLPELKYTGAGTTTSTQWGGTPTGSTISSGSRTTGRASRELMPVS